MIREIKWPFMSSMNAISGYEMHMTETLLNKCIQQRHVSFLIIKITISSIVIGLKKFLFSTNSLVKLLSDSFLLDSLLSDCSMGQSHSKFVLTEIS